MLKRLGLLALTGGVAAAIVAATLGGTASARVGAANAASTVRCGKTVTIGVAYPATGPAASIGTNQWDWAKFAKAKWNKAHTPKIALVAGDTQLAGTNPQAVQVAHSFSSNSKILAVTGPAGSQEVEDSISVYKSGGLGAVSGSATRVALTRAKPGTPRETPTGFFFRTVPNDGQQGDRVAYWIHNVLKATKVYVIDDEEAYSQGLADQVTADLTKDGLKHIGRNHISQQTPDYSSVIDAIPSSTEVVYIPWQVSSMAQTFYQQLRAHGKKAIVFGSDGTDDPSTFKGAGSYVSGFPVDFTSKALKAFKASHKGQTETFGIPSYTSVWVNATAIKMACAAGHGKTSRSAVRKDLLKVSLTSKQSLLGFPVKFLTKNKGSYQGPGDMGGTANFAIYQIQSNGTYKRVG